MAERKTQQTTASVETFLKGIEDEGRRQDCFRVLEIMKAATKSEPAMWGTSIVGFGRYNYKPESGSKGEWFLAGFASRKQDLTLYLMSGAYRYPELLKKLGKHKTGRACLYIKKLDDVHVPTLKQLIQKSIADVRAIKK
jgi:hypothetical protein